MIKASVLWLINEQGEILLAQRAHHKAQDPSVWGTAAAGKLEPGESFDDALVREVGEELGLKTTDYTPHFLFERDFDHPDSEQRKFGIYYATFPKAKTSLIQIDSNEVAGIKWLPIEEIEHIMKSSPQELVPSANAIWPEVLVALQKVALRSVSPEAILPSQDFLKENTVRYILDCISKGRNDDLPPTPLVRKGRDGKLVAIDGHNLIAVRLFRNEPVEVIVANSPQDGLPATTDANKERNRELSEKFDTVLDERQRVEKEGILTFSDLIRKYPDLFNESTK